VPGLPLIRSAPVPSRAPYPILLQFDDAPCAWRGVAGPFAVLADRDLPGFAPATAIAPPPPPVDAVLERRHERGWIDDAERSFVLERHAHHAVLAADGARLAWTADGARVWVRGLASARDGLAFGVGIGLVAALAARGVFCLHASALRWRGGCVAFAGPSGAGKSTFARAIDAAGLAARVADDILPLDRDGLAWPAFPQLKLPATCWHPPTAGGLRLRALVVLARGAAPHCAVLPSSQAVQALVAATAGARAFPEPVLAAHLEACARWSAVLPVWRLVVPTRAPDPEGAARAAFDVLEAQP
jgi:hypothetical protein